MSYKVNMDQVPDLLQMLEKWKLDCYQTYTLIMNSYKTRNKYPYLEIFVDSEDVGQVTSVVALWHQDFPPAERWYFVFTTDTEKLNVMIRTPGVFTVVNDAKIVLACEKSATEVVSDFVTMELGLQPLTIHHHNICTTSNLEMLEETLRKPIPADFRIAPLAPTHAGMVQAAWNFKHALGRLETIIKAYPNLAVYNDAGEPVSWVIAKEYGDIGMTYTIPDYRRRGFASTLVAKIAKLLLENGEMPLVKIRASKTPSLNMHTKLGFQKHCQVAWYFFNPGGN